MKDSGVAGRPEEYFEAKADTGLPAHPGDYLQDIPPTGAGIRDDVRPPRAAEHSSLWGLPDYRAHLERTFELGTGGNGVFGTKLMWHHLPELERLAGRLPEYAGLDRHELLRELFAGPRYVWVRRRDRVRQAVSLWRALQTRAWRAHLDDQASPALTYSFDGIDHLVELLRADDEGWQRFFETSKVPVLEVVYESHLEQDPKRTAGAVLNHIGIAAPYAWKPAEVMERQADGLSAAWVAAYHRDAAGASRSAALPAL